jgi:hypothetical protein
MADEISSAILSGIDAYLREHFPVALVSRDRQARTRTVTFHVRDSGQHHYLEVTERYLDGDDGGADAAIRRLVDWRVAELLRQAGGSVVTLRTDGPWIGVPPRPPPQ